MSEVILLTFQLDIQQVIDTDFVLLPAHLDLAQAMTPLLRKPGRLGVVTSSNETILGCLDSFDIAKSWMNGLPTTTALQTLQLTQPLLIEPSIEGSKLFAQWSKDFNRPVLVRGLGNNILGHLSSAKVLEWLNPLQEQLQAEITRLKLELARRDEYLGIVSHDLRAPLSVIQLAVDFLQVPEYANTMSVQIQSFIERIKRNCDSAKFLVSGLLESIRTAGGLRLSFDQVVLSSILDDVVLSLNLVAQKKGQIIIARHIDEIKIYLDIGRIRQVMENLIMNAIKYSPANAQINAQTYLEERDGSQYAVIKLSNPGERISPEEGRRLFTPFVQGDNAVPLADGVGLGLSIVQKVVELHEGFIEVGSDKEDEVCFRVFLPNATSVLGVHKDRLTSQADSILLVDDDEGIREFTEAGLTAAGFQVFTAEDGARALSIFQRHKPSLILSDIRMNRVDGFELLAKIRETSPLTPVILCSGFYAGLEKDLKHSALKPDIFIDKPFRINELVVHIKRLLAELEAKKEAEKLLKKIG